MPSYCKSVIPIIRSERYSLLVQCLCLYSIIKHIKRTRRVLRYQFLHTSRWMQHVQQIPFTHHHSEYRRLRYPMIRTYHILGARLEQYPRAGEQHAIGSIPRRPHSEYRPRKDMHTSHNSNFIFATTCSTNNLAQHLHMQPLPTSCLSLLSSTSSFLGWFCAQSRYQISYCKLKI